MATIALVANHLADNNFGDTETGGLAGPMGLFIILLLAIGTVLLIRNMNSRLRRLPDRFPGAAAAPDGSAGEGSPAPGTTPRGSGAAPRAGGPAQAAAPRPGGPSDQS